MTCSWLFRKQSPANFYPEKHTANYIIQKETKYVVNPKKSELTSFISKLATIRFFWSAFHDFISKLKLRHCEKTTKRLLRSIKFLWPSRKPKLYPINLMADMNFLKPQKVSKSQKQFFLKLHFPKNEQNIRQDSALWS